MRMGQPTRPARVSAFWQAAVGISLDRRVTTVRPEADGPRSGSTAVLAAFCWRVG